MSKQSVVIVREESVVIWASNSTVTQLMCAVNLTLYVNVSLCATLLTRYLFLLRYRPYLIPRHL
jgi:hypothetical protein